VTSVVLFPLMIGGYLAGAIGACVFSRGLVARWLTGVGALVGGASALTLGGGKLMGWLSADLALVWITEKPSLVGSDQGVAAAYIVHPLSAVFLAVVGAIAIPAALYSIGYARAWEGRRSLRMPGVMLNLFLLCMSVVPLAESIFWFVLFWEGMAISSYLLVMTEADEPETVRAGIWYLGMTQFGLGFILAAFFLLLPPDGSGDFTALARHAATLSPDLKSLVFVLALIGFGSKAGLVPLHVWLPSAHPAAPSHVSALMSGVMIKLGVYGVLLFTLRLLGGGPVWWGGLVLTLGAISALLGVLYALMEHDLKRLLAYHSIENIGIIFIGVGAGMMFLSYGLPALAVLGFVGGLYHTINHACFKGLLFLGAGSVLHATHTRNMEEMGGLIKRMPRTALFFLVGAAAISALPPLNGFVSEWVVFQALLGGASIPRREVAVLMPVAVAMLALASGLAAACFVKAFGITFLGIARSHEAEQAHEVPASMQVAMAALALACVVLGAAAYAMVPALARAVAGLAGLPPASVMTVRGSLSLPLSAPGAVGQISPLSILLGLVLLLAAVPTALWLFRASRALRVSDTWGCGRIAQTPRMQYTATAFAEPLRRIFAALYRPTEDVSIDFHPESRYFVQSIAYRAHIVPWFERYLYDPVIDRVMAWAAHVRAIQSGSLHAYLTYLVAALVTMLGLLLLWGS
jgi:hydrogenase-4 component B